MRTITLLLDQPLHNLLHPHAEMMLNFVTVTHDKQSLTCLNNIIHENHSLPGQIGCSHIQNITSL